MAYDINTMSRVSSSANSKAPILYSYGSATDDAATIKGVGYFNPKKIDLKIGDGILVHSSDGKLELLKVTALEPSVTVAHADFTPAAAET